MINPISGAANMQDHLKHLGNIAKMIDPRGKEDNNFYHGDKILLATILAQVILEWLEHAERLMKE